MKSADILIPLEYVPRSHCKIWH